ncbi:hemerythrin domain-containing protein [Anaeromyxobacter oryzae]|uniref:hemerythrin domain-containing protein n=1 Tax=Anaeromyxobacter oryzae TaxID=2918170 RepID=UPI0020BE1943|nr:hemerythrin domain-containing protein [Anaeromyxobacter oryzae]
MTQGFLDGHAALRKQLEIHKAGVGGLHGASREAARVTMDRAVLFLDEEIRPHASWEEVKFYPLLDSMVGGRAPFTATMRHEHAIIDRWIEDLAVNAGSTAPDVVWFARSADRLFGLIEAHFEEEEAVLLPILERRYETADDFERAVGGEIHAHSH